MERIETLFLGKDLRFYKELESTNKMLKTLLREEKCSEGLVVKADFQTAGRGQRNSEWISPEGDNLLMSLLLFPKFLRPEQQFDLNKIVSLSILSLLENFGIEDVKVKWPNDVYVDNKKISGILIENGLSGNTISESIVGVGLNVNTVVFPEKIKSKTCSIASILRKRFDVNEILFQLIKNIEQYYLLLKAGKFNGIHKQFVDSMYGMNLQRAYTLADGSALEGIIIGLDESGRLLVQVGDQIRHFRNKELQFNY